MTTGSNCPSDGEMDEWLMGRGTRAANAEIEAHLMTCESCVDYCEKESEFRQAFLDAIRRQEKD